MKHAVLLLLPVSFACIPNEAFVNSQPMVSECEGAMPSKLRVASYNVRSGAESSLEEVGDVIVEMAPDVLALQEVNVDFKGEDQVKLLAARLGYPYVYASALSRGMSHTYGIALISRFPLKRVERKSLWSAGAAEPRAVIDADVCVGNTKIRVLSTHADVWQPSPNLEEVRKLLASPVTEKTIVVGDFNVQPGDGPAERFASNGLTNLMGKHAEGPTFWSSKKRLDFLFVDPWLEARATGASIGASRASDHHPIWADFALQ